MSRVDFTSLSWVEYINWMRTDRKVITKINSLIEDIRRNGPMKGTGHPERLKHQSAYSRSITDEHRLVYEMENGDIIIVSCFGHYEERP